MLTDSELAPIVDQAKQLWADTLGGGDPRLSLLNEVQVQVGNLPDQRLGVTLGETILIDTTASGYGWFVGGSGQSPAGSGQMDLLTVVAHELGNAMGFAEDAHATDAVTSPLLGAGDRHLPGIAATSGDAQQGASAPAFDPYPGYTGVEVSTGIDWQDGGASDGWDIKLSPYDTSKPVKGAPGVAPFDLNLLAQKAAAGKLGAEFDSMGQALLGKGKGS